MLNPGNTIISAINFHTMIKSKSGRFRDPIFGNTSGQVENNRQPKHFQKQYQDYFIKMVIKKVLSNKVEFYMVY